jgi:hypothetical protein
LREILHYISSVNLTRENHYFAFDEVLERFGVKFIKQTIGGDVTNTENLFMQIQGAQDEKARLQKMMSEFIDDPASYNPEERIVKSRKEDVWNLAHKLTEAFSLPDPKASPLFENTKEMKDGVSKILACYEKGVQRLEAILAQDVRKTEDQVTEGRREKDVPHYTPARLKAEQKAAKAAAREVAKRAEGKEKAKVLKRVVKV